VWVLDGGSDGRFGAACSGEPGLLGRGVKAFIEMFAVAVGVSAAGVVLLFSLLLLAEMV
jgi:hypothetical protein